MRVCTYGMLLFLLVSLSAAPEARGRAIDDERPAAGWIAAGRTLPMSSGMHRPPAFRSGRFRRFAPPVPVSALTVAADTLWIGTGGGLFAWSIEGDELFSVDGPVGSFVRSIAVDRGRLWVGCEHGLSVRSVSGWSHYLPSEAPVFGRVTDIHRGDGKMWIGSWGGGAGFIRDDSLTIYTRADSLLDDRVTCVLEETPDIVWFGTASGMCRADSFSWEGFRYGSGIPIGRVADAIFDEEGSLFIAVDRGGTAMYDFGRVSVFGTVDGLPSDDIRAFSIDGRGAAWAAGRGGVSFFDGSGWVPFSAEGYSFAGKDFRAMHHDLAGRLFLGTADGLVLVVSRGVVREIQLPSSFPASRVSRISPGAGGMLFLADGAILRLGGGRFDEVARPDALYAPAVADFVELNGLWLATRFGALHYSDGAWEVFDRRHGLPTEHLTAVAAGPGGTLWFGTFDRGVLELGAGGWVHYTVENGLPADEIADIAVDGAGTVWVGTSDGRLARFLGDAWEPIPAGGKDAQAASSADTLDRIDPAFRLVGAIPAVADRHCRLGTAPGGGLLAVSSAIWRLGSGGAKRILSLPDERIRATAILETADGAIWLATDGDGLWTTVEGRWHRARAVDGVGDDRLLSLAVDETGTIWIGTAGAGLTAFSPAAR